MPLPRRFPKRPPRLDRIFQREQNPVYFLTFCTNQRQPWLACPSVRAAFLEFAARAHAEHHIAIGRYVIMPDHLHLFVSGSHDFPLSGWVKMLKQVLGKAAASKPEPGQSLWQPGLFDLVRSDESMAQKWEYIRQNPVRTGLVKDNADWPYQGEFVPIDRA